jgi:hypothetical protein
MSLTSVEINDLLRRAQLSAVRGYAIAHADFYARELGGGDGSPAGLVALCRAALEKNAPITENAPALPEGDKGKTLPEVASAGDPEPASPEPPAAPESTPESPAAEESPEDDNSEAYESWSKKKLLAAATERGLDVNAHNTKAEIIAALRAI